MKTEKHFSARQVAIHCHVNFKTVLKWIEEKKLPAYQLPDSGVNRILPSDLIDFLKKYGFPVPEALQDCGPLRLLIVDDEPGMVNTIRRLLRSTEFTIESARDGFEAGRKVELFKPDIMILDLKMPGISGQEVLREIKGNAQTRHIRVIILSAFVRPEEIIVLKQAGAESVMDKPIDRERLFTLLKSAVGDRMSFSVR